MNKNNKFMDKQENQINEFQKFDNEGEDLNVTSEKIDSQEFKGI